MAKTKGSNPPLTELVYTDASGRDHFAGDLIRQTINSGFISPHDPEWDITTKSNRGERPTQQGDGSDLQKSYRQAFRDCTQLWNTLPSDCPDPPTFPLKPSKKSVWEAKLEHGVVCSYIDLFLRCCMGFAISHDGAMPTDECFPCEIECLCDDISIGYTTQGMQINEQQDLEVLGAIEGCVYTWEISSGGGSLSSSTGVSVVYTAPATNPNCENNATITLSTDDVQCDTLQIAVNGAGSEYNDQYWKYTDTYCRFADPQYRCGLNATGYNCIGEITSGPTWRGTYSYVDCPDCVNKWISGVGCQPVQTVQYCEEHPLCDDRSEAALAAGCCPSALL